MERQQREEAKGEKERQKEEAAKKVGRWMMGPDWE